MNKAFARPWTVLNSKIHPPHLSTRGSQQLLSLLDGSFKQQLDRQHPADSSSNEHDTANHLQSILTDPLFNVKPRTSPSSKDESQFDSKPRGRLMRRPMDTFKKLIAQGRADLTTAHYFLGVEYKSCLDSPAATPREAMQSSGAGSIILQWLWSSGVEDKGKFLENRELIVILVRFLVAEGRQSRILRWLRRCDTAEETPFSSLHELDTSRIQRLLLARLIDEEIINGDGLDSAIALFLRAVDGLWNSGPTNRSQGKPAIRAAYILAEAMLRLPEAVELEPSVFQSLSKTMRDIGANPLLHAILCVCCKRRPDPWPALAHFQMESAKAMMYMPFRYQAQSVSLGLKAATVFLRYGQRTEASWIVEFLRTKFAEELGPPLPQTHKAPVVHKSQKMTSQEMTSLRLLDTLAV